MQLAWAPRQECETHACSEVAHNIFNATNVMRVNHQCRKRHAAECQLNQGIADVLEKTDGMGPILATPNRVTVQVLWLCVTLLESKLFKIPSQSSEQQIKPQHAWSSTHKPLPASRW